MSATLSNLVEVVTRQSQQTAPVRSTLSRVMNSSAKQQQLSARGKHKPIFSKSQFKIVIITAIVFACSLAVLLTVCIVARCCRRQRRPHPMKQTDPEADALETGFTHMTATRREDLSGEDSEILAQLDALEADQTMANENFRGRELDVYRKEMRAKAKRQARGAMRTSQGINLPVHVRQLKGKMRSLVRSLTRSEAVPETTREPTSLPEISEPPVTSLALSNTASEHQNTANLQKDDSEKSLRSPYPATDLTTSALPKALLCTEPSPRREIATSDSTTSTEPSYQNLAPRAFSDDSDNTLTQTTPKAA